MSSGGPPRLVLVVTAGGTATTVSLPMSGSLTIGRAPECDVRIDDPSVSRKHAVLRIGRASASVEDLGSQNGTRLKATRDGSAAFEPTLEVRERRLEPNVPAELAPGDCIWVGSALLVLRAPAREHPAGVVVQDPRMQELFGLVERVAVAPLHVLIVGETGTGKEVVAEAVHAASQRAAAPLVRVNCAALPESLVESALFGHERGAFTGADRRQVGLLESADGGTVFLDEVGELPLSAQAKLLRVLEDRRVTRVGAVESLPIDVRFVAATHRDLRARANEGLFREDLFFRLDGFTLRIPPLRERRVEIEPLTERFLAGAAERAGRAPPALAPDARDALLRHSWPGNVRELRNVIERAMVLADGGSIGARHLQFSTVAASVPAPATDSLPAAVEEIERNRILEALTHCGGNQTRAARMLGISRRTLVYRLGKYELPRPRSGRVGS